VKSAHMALLLVPLIGLLTGRLEAQVSSTFDTGRDSWTVADIVPPLGNPPSVATVYTPDWSPAGGNPGGSISMTDPSGNWFFFSAPASFLGDKSGYYGGNFTYDLKCSPISNLFEPGVALVGQTSTLYYSTNSPPPGWINYTTPLTPSGWRLNNYVNGPEPSVAQMQSVLGNVKAVYISGDRFDGTETAGLDNIRMLRPPPAPPPTRPNLPTVSPPPSGGTGLICVVPGWHSSVFDWAEGMKVDIQTKLSDAGESTNWTVEAKGWDDTGLESWLTTPTPDKGALVAGMVGGGFGKEIKDAGYKKVHFIAHSDGAWFIDAATQKIKQLDPTIQVECTFLDPYLKFAKTGRGPLGQKADISESYFSAKDAWFTNSSLDHAYNFDVTNVGDVVVPKVNTTDWIAGHNWPYQWYAQTVKNYDPVNRTGWAYGYGYGFPLSMEMNGGVLPSISDPAFGGVKVLPPGTAGNEVALPLARIDAVLNFGNLAIYQSDTGTKVIEGTKLTMTTGSPVWMTSLLTVTQPVNFVEFQAEFTSAAGAEGLLTIYWAGQPIGLIDERWVLEGMQDYVFALPGTSDPGTYDLSFRLDPYTDTPSSVVIDNAATAYVVPEPSTIILGFTGVVCLLLFDRRHHRRTGTQLVAMYSRASLWSKF